MEATDDDARIRLEESGTSYGRDAADRLDEAATQGVAGARALVETFYHAFNHGDAALLGRTWRDDPLVQLNNPLGGMLFGREAIETLYAGVFSGAGTVWVELADIVEMRLGDAVVFAGRETGEYRVGDQLVALRIRTSRIVAFDAADGGWRMVHHHGSIDDPEALATYQGAVEAAKG